MHAGLFCVLRYVGVRPVAFSKVSDDELVSLEHGGITHTYLRPWLRAGRAGIPPSRPWTLSSKELEDAERSDDEVMSSSV